MHLRDNTSDQKVYREIFIKKVYEKHGFKIDSGESWIDLGAYIGFFSAYAQSRGAIIKKIYEPFAENIPFIKDNLKQSCEAIIPKCVTARGDGKQAFYICKDGNYQRNTTINHYKRKEMITRLVDSDAFGDILFDDCCVKMDIEGSELAIIDECHPTFKKINKMVLEYHTDKDNLLENYYRRVKILEKYFAYVKYDRLKQKDGSTRGALKIFPSGRLIYCCN
ncbi:hypothetical protein LCGC14_0609010 [marine sediment metagenome]|uniref:Uncharacterized protein n=1 Tax=marine sediment metagenome TaxID=412755 RepID=A0A0F9UGR8_9ZZZZ